MTHSASPGGGRFTLPAPIAPNVTEQRVIYPSLVTAEWVAAQREEWGEESAAYRARVLGEFPEEDGSHLIPLAWIHAARERPVAPDATGGPLRLGVDVARYGADQTVLVLATPYLLKELNSYSGLSTMDTTGRVIALAAKHRIPPEHIAVDDTGVGGAVTDRLREQGWPIVAVNAASSSHNAHFANRRAEMYWGLRAAFNPEGSSSFALHGHRTDRLCRELSEITYQFNSQGRIRIDPKDELKQRLGHSPDHADALALTFAGGHTVAAPPRVWAL